MKKLLYLVILFAYVMGFIGGIGYTCYVGEYVIAAAVAVMGVLAFPTAKYFYHKMMEC